jgi:VWFA-related protein
MCRGPASRLVILVLVAAVALARVAASARQAPVAAGAAATLRITSPLGRIGQPGTVRIVAQIQDAAGVTPGAVEFYVDGKLVGRAASGPPYAVDWIDENPYEARDISAEAIDSAGRVLRDTVHLRPLEVVEQSTVSRVLLEASVQDKEGRFVSGLTAANFQLQEDGVPQSLELLKQETAPVTFALLVDSSQSMSTRIDSVRAAAARLATGLRADDLAIVAPFNRRLRAITGPSRDAATIAQAIDGVSAGGGTAILDCLTELAGRLQDVPGRHVIVLITDGYDEQSTTSFEAALHAVKAAQGTVYVVGIGGVAGISLHGEDLLRQLVRETGGRAFFPYEDDELGSIAARIGDDAEHRYLLSYMSTNDRADGQWRRIALTTTPQYSVRTRTGYFAPTPSPVRATIELTVTAPGGQPANVTADDLVVREDGVVQHIDSFEEAVAPISIVLALDASGSMRRSAPDVLQAARAFVDALRPEDRLAVLSFADQVVLTQDFSTDRGQALQAIAEYRTGGGTALYDGLTMALRRLEAIDTRRVIVVLTDGRDENDPGTAPGSVATLPEVLAATRRTGAAVFTLGLGSHVDRAMLQQLAQTSGGHAYFPADVSQLPDEYHRVLEDLRRRFIISYMSTNAAHDGRWRSVDIRTRDGALQVESQGGYFAPGQ